jgi:RNA polymerase sigma factor (sigma-70 family)
MESLRKYTEDLEIAQKLIERDEKITRHFFYIECYPLFKAIHQNYFTDTVKVSRNTIRVHIASENDKACNEGVIEFINEIYIHILKRSPKTGKCQLENYKGESSLASWLKTVCLFYCYKKYKRKKGLTIVDIQPELDEENPDGTDRIIDNGNSYEPDFEKIDQEDVEAILKLMPNKRYRELIRMRYIEMMTNEETAKELGINNMDNYYNIHKRAKSQLERVCRKEDYYG